MKDNLYKILNISALIEIYALANTPHYLYEKFKEQDSLVNISKKYNSSEITEVFYKLLENKISNISELVFAYALIVSLTNKPYKEVKTFFEGLAEINIKWFDKISDIYLSTASVNQFITKKAKLKKLISVKNISFQPSDSAINKTTKPELTISNN